MADRYLLESGAPDGYLLEDGSGVLLLDDSAYRTEVLVDSPAGYWRLGEGSGYPEDSAGSNDATAIFGTPTYGLAGAIAGDANTAVAFDGSTEYFSVPDAAALDLGDTFTLEAWVRHSVAAGIQALVSKGVGAYYLRLNGDSLELARSNTAVICTSTVTVPVDTSFHHVVATKTGAAVKLYIDGVDRTGTVTDSTCANTTNPLFIGSDRAVEFHNDRLDEVAVYPTVLSAARVLAHYNAGIGGQTVSPAANSLTVTPEAPTRLDQTIEPAAIAIALVAETPSIPQIVDAGAIALSLATLAPAQFDVTAEPGAVTLALTAEAPRSDLEAAPGPVAMALASPAPDVVATIAPAAVSLTVDVLAWQRMDVDAPVGAIALSVAAVAPEIAAAILPDQLALAIAALAPERTDQDTSPPAIALALSPLAPTRLDFEVAADAQGVTLTPVPFARVDQDATPAAITLTLALPAPAVNLAGSDTISPDALALALGTPAPQADLDATVAALGLSVAAQTPQGVDQAILPDPAVLTITAIAPVTDQAVAPATLTILLEAPAPVELEHRLLADTIAIALALLAPSLTNEGGVITGSLRALSVRVVMPAGGMTRARTSMSPGAGPLATDRKTQPE